MKNNLLCFDLDGTLIDSARDVVTAMNVTLKEYNREPLSHDLIVSYIGEGLLKLVQDVFGDITSPKIQEEISQRFLKNYEKHMFDSTELFPGVMNFLQEWDGPKAIITNKNHGPTLDILRHLHIYDIGWNLILGADSLAEKKPSPLPLLTTLQTVGVPKEKVFMIGDGTPDMISAQRAGVKSIAIEFGYTKLDILKKYEPVATLSHYDKLQDLIFSH